MNKTNTRINRRRRIRAKVSGTGIKPRLSVFKSNKFVYVQAIDDEKSVTLASSRGKKAEEVGAKLGQQLVKAKIKKAVFDRGGYRYHGAIKNLADSIRAEGVEF